MTLQEFSSQIRKAASTHEHKITNSYGVYDYYKAYRKSKPKDKKYVLTESQYFAIIRRINTVLATEFVRGKEIRFPWRLGTIELRKFIQTPKIGPDGKVIFNNPIDWDKTIKLWYEDIEARKNKTLVKQESREIFKVFYNKSVAIYNNKIFYMFRLNRELKKEISKNIKRGYLDAFLIH